MIPKILSTAHLTLITLSTLFASIIFITSLFTTSVLPLGLNVASASITVLFHIVIIIFSWRRRLNANPKSPNSASNDLKSPASAGARPLPIHASTLSLTSTLLLLALWLITIVSQVIDILDPNSPNKTRGANVSLQLKEPSGQTLKTNTSGPEFAGMLSVVLVVCEAVEVVVLVGMVVGVVSVRRGRKQERRMKEFALSPSSGMEKGFTFDASPASAAAAVSPTESLKHAITKRFTLKSIFSSPKVPSQSQTHTRNLRVAPFPVSGRRNPNPMHEPTHPLPTAHPVPPQPSLLAPPLHTSHLQPPHRTHNSDTHSTHSRTPSHTSFSSRFSRLTNTSHPSHSSSFLKPFNFKRPGRPWSYLTPGRPSMIMWETPVESAVATGAGALPTGVESVGASAAVGEKKPVASQNYIHRAPTGPRVLAPKSPGEKETFGGVVRVKAPVPPRRVVHPSPLARD